MSSVAVESALPNYEKACYNLTYSLIDSTGLHKFDSLILLARITGHLKIGLPKGKVRSGNLLF